MKLYVAGPMTGLPEFNRPAFFAAAQDLAAAGHDPVNPARRPVMDDWGWVDYMRLGLADVLTVEGVAVLPGWQGSRGARLEVTVARGLELPVRDVAEWVNGHATTTANAPARFTDGLLENSRRAAEAKFGVPPDGHDSDDDWDPDEDYPR